MMLGPQDTPTDNWLDLFAWLAIVAGSVFIVVGLWGMFHGG